MPVRRIEISAVREFLESSYIKADGTVIMYRRTKHLCSTEFNTFLNHAELQFKVKLVERDVKQS